MIGPPGARAPQESVLGQEDTSVDLVLRKGFLILGSPGGEGTKGGMGEEGTKGRENEEEKRHWTAFTSPSIPCSVSYSVSGTRCLTYLT
jgi:hypothetical protein